MKELFKVTRTYKMLPPDDYRPFEWELAKARNSLKMRAYGLSYDVVPRKTLKRDKSDKNLVEFLGHFEKFSGKKSGFCSPDWSDPCNFFREVLEQGRHLMDFEDYIFGFLGVKRDFSCLSNPQRKKIAVQVAAQVLGSLSGKAISIQEIQQLFFDNTHPYSGLFKIGKDNLYFKHRTVRDWIRKAFKISKDSRKGWGSKRMGSSVSFDNLVLIPEVFSEDRTMINFVKLRFVLACITRLLKGLGWSLEQIGESRLINFYAGSLCPHFSLYSAIWVREAFSKNGSIFTS